MKTFTEYLKESRTIDITSKMPNDRWPQAKLMGHNDFPGYESRGCPCFNHHVYFSWLKAAWDSSSKPVDWMDNSKYDWHKSSLLAWEVPDNFLDEVDTGGIRE